VADFHKRVYKDEELKSIKQITVFKTVNRFLKIKKTFTVKVKMISVDHHFQLRQTPKNILGSNRHSIKCFSS